MEYPGIVAIKDAARRARSQRQADEIYRQTHDVFVIFLGPKPEITELAPGEAQAILGEGGRALKDRALLLVSGSCPTNCRRRSNSS